MDYAFKNDKDGRPYVELRPQTSDERDMVENLFPREGEIVVVTRCADYEQTRRVHICREVNVKASGKAPGKYDSLTLEQLQTRYAERGLGTPDPKANRRDLIDAMEALDAGTKPRK